MAGKTTKTYPATGIADLLRLVGGLTRAALRRPDSRDAGLVFSNWINDATARHGSDNHIVKQYPSAQGYLEGPTKARAMSFLAPQALTICHGQQWQRLRPYNERVL